MRRAALAFLITIVASACAPDPAGPAGQAGLAGRETPVPRTPVGEVAWPPAFTWDGVPPGAIVRLRIVDRADRLIRETDARGGVWEPGGAGARWPGGEELRWTVALVDERGEPGPPSAALSFRLR